MPPTTTAAEAAREAVITTGLMADADVDPTNGTIAISTGDADAPELNQLTTAFRELGYTASTLTAHGMHFVTPHLVDRRAIRAELGNLMNLVLAGIAATDTRAEDAELAAFLAETFAAFGGALADARQAAGITPTPDTAGGTGNRAGRETPTQP